MDTAAADEGEGDRHHHVSEPPFATLPWIGPLLVHHVAPSIGGLSYLFDAYEAFVHRAADCLSATFLILAAGLPIALRCGSHGGCEHQYPYLM